MVVGKPTATWPWGLLVAPATSSFKTQHRARAIRHHQSDLGRRDARRGAVQQFRAELGLQILDPLAQRRLSDVESLGRLGDAAGVDDAHEKSELTQIHDTSYAKTKGYSRYL